MLLEMEPTLSLLVLLVGVLFVQIAYQTAAANGEGGQLRLQGSAISPEIGQEHVGIICNGCLLSEKLKQISIAEGHFHEQHGFIVGRRFESQSFEDFDLCESCKNSGWFRYGLYGPFNEYIDPLPHGLPPPEPHYDDRHRPWFFDEYPPEPGSFSYSCEELLVEQRVTKCRRVMMKVATYRKHNSFAVRLDLDQPPLMITFREEESKMPEKIDMRACAVQDDDTNFVSGSFDFQPPDWISGSMRFKDGMWSLDPCLRGEEVPNIDECKTWSYIPSGTFKRSDEDDGYAAGS